MIELRIMGLPEELEQITGVLKATAGIEIISISKDYPNRGVDKRVRSYIKCEFKPDAEPEIFDTEYFPQVENSEDEVEEYMKDVIENEPQVIEEVFFSTFCANCKYLSKTEGANFLCQKSWKEIEDVENFDKHNCPIFRKLQEEGNKECLQ